MDIDKIQASNPRLTQGDLEEVRDLIGQYLTEKTELQLLERSKKALKKLEKKIDYDEYKQFNDLPNCKCIIGETDHKLFDLVHSALLADLIIIGDQQKMLPKLMINYADYSSPPIIVHLHNRKSFTYYDKDIGLNNTNIDFFSINLEDNTIDHDEIIKKIYRKLTYKLKKSANISALNSSCVITTSILSEIHAILLTF